MFDTTITLEGEVRRKPRGGDLEKVNTTTVGSHQVPEKRLCGATVRSQDTYTGGGICSVYVGICQRYYYGGP